MKTLLLLIISTYGIAQSPAKQVKPNTDNRWMVCQCNGNACKPNIDSFMGGTEKQCRKARGQWVNNIESVYITMTQKQRDAFAENAWMKPCTSDGPENHADGCYIPDPAAQDKTPVPPKVNPCDDPWKRPFLSECDAKAPVPSPAPKEAKLFDCSDPKNCLTFSANVLQLPTWEVTASKDGGLSFMDKGSLIAHCDSDEIARTVTNCGLQDGHTMTEVVQMLMNAYYSIVDYQNSLSNVPVPEVKRP